MVKNFQTSSQFGQTLIETMVALFILVMGVSAAAGLAIYTFGASTTVVKQIVATGLAREGLEAVRNMRDTNWLNDTISTNGCYNFETSHNNEADCYKNWLGDKVAPTVPFCINPYNNGNSCPSSSVNSGQRYALTMDSNSANFWSLVRTDDNFGLVLNDPDVSTLWKQYGFYSSSGGTVSCTNAANRSDFCRTIVLTKINDTAPYNIDNELTLLKVQSQVWWVDKKCPRVSRFEDAPLGCRLELDSYLTNWKN